MATFLVAQQELADRLTLDQTITANQTRLQRWLNLIQQDICSRYDFAWLQDRTIIQTVTQKTAGTVSATNGSTSVVGTGTSFAAGDKRSFLQVSNDTNWYEVTNVASQTLTLAQNYVGTTGGALTYTLRQVYYDLPSNCLQVEDVRQTNTPLKLSNLGVYTIDLYQPDIQYISNPTGYYLFREDPDVAVSAAKQQQISFYPIADAQYNMEIRYYKALSDLSSNTDITNIPVQYHTVWIDGAEWLGKKFINDPTESESKDLYEFGLQKMIEAENAHRDYMPVLASSDDQYTSRFLPFPATFEQPR